MMTVEEGEVGAAEELPICNDDDCNTKLQSRFRHREFCAACDKKEEKKKEKEKKEKEKKGIDDKWAEAIKTEGKAKWMAERELFIDLPKPE